MDRAPAALIAAATPARLPDPIANLLLQLTNAHVDIGTYIGERSAQQDAAGVPTWAPERDLYNADSFYRAMVDKSELVEAELTRALLAWAAK